MTIYWLTAGGGVKPALYNGDMKPMVVFGQDGYVLHGDLFGRGKEEVIIITPQTAYIYSGTPYDLSETPSQKAIPQIKRLYASTLYPGGEYR